uniref:SZT2 subunit of KICSTOR complex n=1 Tax=Mastacembelus armatus TaxID=205130 RepID=A0A7N8XHG3_9TELE
RVTQVEEADQIYLLMKEEYRISRNVRLAWFLGKLNQVIWPASDPELLNSENELDLLTILPKGWQDGMTDFSPTMYPYMLMPSTRATFLAQRYRFIIELDLSPSTGIVDDSTGEMIFDEVFHALSRCLAGLVQPFKVPGTDQHFKPKIFITILAYSSIIGLTSHQVLVQGCQLDRTDLDDFLHHIYQQLKAVESNIAEVLHQQHDSGLHGNNMDDLLHRKQGISMVSADMGLVSMVRQGILALQLLPPNSSAGIIIITDGVTSVPDVAVCETLLNQLRSGTIACSFVQVGGAYSYDCSFGYVPNVEMMKFISLATFGSYLPSCPAVDQNSQDMNVYHKAFLTYSFLKSPESMNSEYFCVSQHKLFNEHLVSASGNPALVMRRKKHTEKEVHAHLISVVSVRLREGYTIREINLTKGGTQLEVKLVLLWKHNMHIEYQAAASWPLDPTKRITKVEVTMEGSYDILHDISCTQRKPITSPYRTSSKAQTDQMLVHLQSFNSVPENYMIPESTKNGVPLFYIPPGSTTPVLSLQHSGSKDSSQSQFASYWKPILSMDANFWQRWLHMHRITIILEHDMPVPKHLHTTGNNGRYSTIQCRISHSALTSLLRDWSSFLLVEGYSYVKLIYSSADQPPTSFYLVRLISKTPCMVLRLGFPIGTPAHIRNKIVDELREQILKLRFPHRVQNKEATPKTKRKIVGYPSPSKSPSIPAPKPALSDRPCAVVLNKPLEKLLIRYEKLPSDFRIPFILNMENFLQSSNSTVPLNMAASRTASSTLASLSRYFLHQRWVWAVQSSQVPAVAMHAVAHILSMLSEIRISEGFHFAASGEGIINMVIELPMKGMAGDMDKESHSCIVQYILFPPHATSTKDSFSTDDDNDTEVEAVEVDTELNLVTECWVEPQSGTVMNCMDQHRYFRGLKYQEIPQAIFPKDLACMSTMMTFEHLSQLCQNKDQVCSLPAEPLAAENSIHMIPFQFDLIQLLPQCQQVELLFLTFSTGTYSFSNGDLVEEEPLLASRSCSTPQWRCYAKYISPQQIFLTFLPASFTDVLMLIASGLENEPRKFWTIYSSNFFLEVGEKEGVQFSEPHKTDLHISFSRQVSQQSTSESSQLKCPVYVYNCSLEHLKEQLVHPNSSRQPRDIFFRSLSQDRSSPSPWTELLAQPHRHKELANYCSLLQEHYYQSYVKGMYRSLQQSYSISSQDVLMAMDYCEESLQEIDVTSFLQTLCGHIRVFRDHIINVVIFLGFSTELEDASEAESRGKSCAPQSSVIVHEFNTAKIPEFPLMQLQTQPKCEVYPDLHRIIQDKFTEIVSQYFKAVPSNPHYFFYCPPSSKKEVKDLVSEAEPALEDENVSGCCMMTESDTDLVVEYEEQPGTSSRGEVEDQSLSDSNTVNQDQDSFSILDGDSLLEAEGPQLDMPPLFVHITCSVNIKSCHGSMPIQTLPTCLGKIISCLENAEALQSVDLNELSVTLDIFVLTLPLEIEVMADFHHNRYTSESSVSLNRSPGQPSSYRSDEELMAIRWLLEDEIISALRHSWIISLDTLQKVAEHVLRSSGRPHCHFEDVPLQFVFGPEQSLEKFKEARLLLVTLRECYLISWCEILLTLNLLTEMPSRVQSVVSSQGSLDSDMQGYDGGSSDSECESPTLDEHECQSPLMPDFWLIVKIHQDRVKVYSHSRSENQKPIQNNTELPAYLQLHQMVVRKIGEICRIVNQRMLLQDLHDSHVCNSLLVAESEEDIWKNESLYRQRPNTSDDYSTEESYPARDYLAATMQFVPGHFACDVVWNTVIHIHPRLKMGPNMGVSRAIQALRSVLNSFCVVNRKNMFVYQERTTKSVFYLRLCETSQTGKYFDVDRNLHVTHSIGLIRSQEPLMSEDLMVKGSRPVGQVDKHILLLVHGVGNAGPEITDELVKVLRKRLDETTLDIITVMLVRNCKLTPADVEFIQPSGSPATEVMNFSLPQYCLSWLPAVAHYLRQNLLIFLHVPKYTDSNTAHHFKHYFHLSSNLADSDIYLYNKPGGQGTGGKGNYILAVRHAFSAVRAQFSCVCVCVCPQLYVRFDIWEQGNVSPLQLTDKLQGALHHALCDIVMELRVLPNPLCLGALCPATKEQKEEAKAVGSTPITGINTPESTTPTGKSTRRSFWDILSKPDSSELGSPKTTDDIVQEKGEEGRAARRRHKTETVKQQWSQEKAMAVELEQAQRRQVSQLEEGDVGTLHPVYQITCQPWITFMAKLGCPSIQQCTAEIASQFLLPSILAEVVNLVSSLASDTTVKAFKKTSCPTSGNTFVPFPLLYLFFPPLPSKEQGRLGSSSRSLAPLHFPSELLPFDEALRDVCTIQPLMEGDVVARHGNQLLEIKAAERRELEKQMKIENLFVTWQQRSAQSNMPISGTDLEILKQSSRLVHYCATPLLFDPGVSHGPDSTASGRDRSYSTDSADMLPSRLKEEPWLLEISSTFLQQYVQYLQSMGFILVQVRPQSPARSSISSEGRMSFSYVKQKSEDSPKVSTTPFGTTAYHLQRALPGGIVLMELAFQGCYFCVKQYALECSRIPMGQTVNSQLSMLFTEECDKVRDLMHVHSFSYDFHLRVVHQYLVGCHMTLRQGYHLTDFLDDFISHHPDIPKFGRNHVFQGSFSISTGMITAHQLYNYITDHASTYGMKPLRMSKTLVHFNLVSCFSSGTYKDLEGLHHHDDFDVSLVVCHNAAPFEEQSDGERHLLRLRFYVIMTSQRELFPRLTADMRRFKKLPQIYRDPCELTGRDGNEFYPLVGGGAEAQGLLYPSPLFPLLNNEVASARRQIQASAEQAMGHCRRDNLWRRLFHGEHLALDKLKLPKLSFSELEELLNAVQSRSVGEIDPQLDCFLTMSPAWYQSLIKVLLNHFPQSCRHFDDNSIQYLAVLNQKFTDCFVLVFLDTQAGKTSLKVVFREPLPSQPQASNNPPPQLVSMYHHLESVINTACYNLWTGLL